MEAVEEGTKSRNVITDPLNKYGIDKLKVVIDPETGHCLVKGRAGRKNSDTRHPQTCFERC